MTIKFRADWSAQEVIFLDTRAYIKNGKVKTDLHVKLTSKHQSISTDQKLSPFCKTAIQYSQALRIKRICSERENLSLRTNQSKHHLSREDTPSICLTQKSIKKLIICLCLAKTHLFNGKLVTQARHAHTLYCSSVKNSISPPPLMTSVCCTVTEGIQTV